VSDLALVGLLSDVLPQGPGPAADASLVTTGTVYAVDATAGLVQVGVRDAALWVSAQAGRYTVGTAARVLMDPAAGRPVLVLGPLRPSSGSVVATVLAVSGNTVTVSWAGQSMPLPAIPHTYTVGSRAYVSTDDWGQPERVDGPTDLPAASAPAPQPAPEPSVGTRQVTVTIQPQWSGTWRSSRGAYDRWNLHKYGRAALWQGNSYGSGPLTGIAVYGSQLVNLGAISIDAVAVNLSRLEGSGSATVQGTSQGTASPGAPVPSGDTASGNGWVSLPSSVRTAMRTGAVRGLCLVGGAYGAWRGAGQSGGMALRVTYTRDV
jgi:hypothetical protein